MNDGLDTTLLLPDVGEKPSVIYRNSAYTVRQYCALPYAQRVAVDADCDERAGIVRTDYADETSPQPYTVGRATQKLKGACQAPFKSAQQAQLLTPTSTPAMTTAVHPQPAAALHYLHTPEAIEHDAAHPDSLATYALPEAPAAEVVHENGPPASTTRNAADLLDVVSRYVVLTENTDETEWTHWGPSPFVRGDTHSFALNLADNVYKCFTTHKTGDVVDFIMFMEELSEGEALGWLATHFPNYYAPEPAAEIAGSTCDSPGPRTVAPGAESAAHGDFAFTVAGLPERAPLGALAAALHNPAPAAPPVAHEDTVYETTDYEMFKMLPGNRPVDPKQVRQLVVRISQRNLLRSQPLDVTADLGLVDGQHRLAAARELGVPIFYRISEQLGDEDITMLNETRKNWGGVDYLHSFTAKGYPDYIALSEFMARHPKMSFSNAKLMLSLHRSAGNDDFKLGRWKVGEADKAEQVAGLVERIIAEVKTFKQPTHSGFVAALYHCVVNIDGFEPKEMMRTVLLQPLSLVPCSSHKQWLEMLGKIYNYRKVAGHQLRFE